MSQSSYSCVPLAAAKETYYVLLESTWLEGPKLQSWLFGILGL